ncbi:hypothetical protein EZV61_02350 [Corallincola luteus]|uniref:Uncharacterized protein n=1 Tax=Corallincola luteus TaxID=1775177 RepID=A0ABY2ANQ6_9GAMM|nr:hypothetical protein [Corallincola luteus]TCI04834.1 hypothetical protein EZV61_02350 [Corallincola luteus]
MHQDLLSQVTSWNESPVDGDESKSLKWVKVVTLDTLGLLLGISSNGRWLRVGSESVYEFDSKKSFMPLYPILEVVLKDVKFAIKRGLESQQLPADLLESFPFQDVVLSGINSGSEYWCNLSLKYVEQLPCDVVISKALDLCSKNGPTQKLRHQAKKLRSRSQIKGVRV